jgi:hypothetical protein|tara:strand:+ start:2767 stop:2979 length:213 start_codon:yes stop_codon:yes gene_type:complete
MENIGQPKDTPKRRWDVVEQRGIDMDRSLPCILCRCSAIGAGGGCCADCMMTIILENQRFKSLINIKKLW